MGEMLANHEGSKLVSQSQQPMENAANLAADQEMSAELSVEQVQEEESSNVEKQCDNAPAI